MTAQYAVAPSPKGEDLHGLRQGEFIALMSCMSAAVAISIDTILPAFDEIEEQFSLADGLPVSLAVTVFLAAMGIGMLLWGPLSDRFGRLPTLYVSFGFFIAGSLISTFAASFTVFLIGRVLWGVAAAGPRTIGLAIARDSYDGDLMARIMSLTSAVFFIVPILAPAVGEGLLQLGSWRLTTAMSSVLGVGSVLWLTRLNETLDPDDVLPLQVRRITRAARVVVNNRTTAWFTVAAVFAYGAFFPWLGSSATMIGDIYDRPGQFAVLFGANAILMAVAIVITERLVRRHQTAPVLTGLVVVQVIAAAVYVAVSLLEGGVPGFWMWFAMVSVITATNAASTPLIQSLAMSPMGAIAGTAASVTGAATFIIGAVLGSIVDRLITETVTPFGVSYLIYGTISAAAVVLGVRAHTDITISKKVTHDDSAEDRDLERNP